MKTRLALLTSFVISSTFTLPAMIVHNDLQKDHSGVRSEPKTFGEDYLFMGRDLHLSGQVEDLVFLGNKLDLPGKTTLGVFALCQHLSLSGESGNGIMVGCMDIDITGKITGNNYVACKSMKIGEKSVINGNLFAASADLKINGMLNGNLYTATHDLVINNEIRGNVVAYARRVHIGEKGKITGTLTYTAQKELSKEELTRVTGKVTHEKKYKPGQGRTPSRRASGYLIGAALILSHVIAGLLLLFLPSFRILDSSPQSEQSFWRTALRGLIPLLMYPAIIVLCFVLIITIPFGIVLLLALIPLMYLAWIIGALLFGKYLVSKFNWHVQKRHYQFLIGGLALVILSLIPFVNVLAILFIEALGWGVYLSFLFKKEE